MPRCDIREQCPDCGVGLRQLHRRGCTVERCPKCGLQVRSCDCKFERWGIRFAVYRIRWIGYWPGVKECWRYGFWCRYEPGKWGGWIQCEEDDPGAREDLNRLMAVCKWDRNVQRWVPLKEPDKKKRESILRLTSSSVLLIVRAYGMLTVRELLAMFPEPKKYATELKLRRLLEQMQKDNRIQLCKDAAVESDNDMDLVVKLC